MRKPSRGGHHDTVCMNGGAVDALEPDPLHSAQRDADLGVGAAAGAQWDAARGAAAAVPPVGGRRGGALRRVRRVVQAVVGIGGAVLLLGWVLPWLTNASWAEILDQLAVTGWANAAGLLVLMLIALWCYTFTLTGSLPGLKHRPALIANLIGSGVSDAVPGGGAVGLAATIGIFRSWGFSHRDIGTSVIVTTMWNLLIRALLPFVAIVWLLFDGSRALPPLMVWGGWFAAAVTVAIAGLALVILVNDRGARTVGALLDRVATPLLRAFKRHPDQTVEHLVVDLRSRTIGVIRPNWIKLTFGVVGLLGTYFVIFWLCMRQFGIELALAQVFACYALSRLLTMVPLTPGGIGMTELASGLMIAFGADGAAAAASVVLFAVYSHLLEIPLGTLMAGIWWTTRKRFAIDRKAVPA